MNKQKILIGLGLACACGLLLYAWRSEDASLEEATLRGQSTAGAQVEFEVMQDKLRRAELKIAELEAQLSEAQHSLGQAQAQEDEEASEEQKSRIDEERVKEALTRHMQRLLNQGEEKILALRSRLNLSGEQEAALRNFLAKGRSLDIRLRYLMMTGQSNSPERSELQREAAKLTFDDYVKSVLTPEQAEVYEDYKAESDRARNEARAARQLSDVTAFLQLDESQKDQLFQVFYYQSVDGSGWDATMDEQGRINIDAYIDERVKAVESILNEEQQAVYRTRLELNRDNFEHMFKRFDR